VLAQSRQAQRKQATRSSLIEAAKRVMAEIGVEASSFRDLAAAADLGLGTFYTYFRSKEEIVEVIVAQSLEALGSALDRLTAGMKDPAEVLSVSIRHTLRSVIDDPLWGWFVLRVEHAGDQLARHLGHRCARDIARGVQAGRFNIQSKQVALVAVEGIVLAGMRARLLDRMRGNDEPKLTACALQVLGLRADEALLIASKPLPAVPQQTW
jgi:AcrR family transcriptional regulator